MKDANLGAKSFEIANIVYRHRKQETKRITISMSIFRGCYVFFVYIKEQLNILLYSLLER